MTAKEGYLYVFTDGGCRDNGKRGAKAAYAVFFSEDQENPWFESNVSALIAEDPTNQKAELCAIQKALEILAAKTAGRLPVTIVTDSMYSINCLTRWGSAWTKNDFKTAKGRPVKHRDIIQTAMALAKGMPNVGSRQTRALAHATSSRHHVDRIFCPSRKCARGRNGPGHARRQTSSSLYS